MARVFDVGQVLQRRVQIHAVCQSYASPEGVHGVPGRRDLQANLGYPVLPVDEKPCGLCSVSVDTFAENEKRIVGPRSSITLVLAGPVSLDHRSGASLDESFQENSVSGPIRVQLGSSSVKA